MRIYILLFSFLFWSSSGYGEYKEIIKTLEKNVKEECSSSIFKSKKKEDKGCAELKAHLDALKRDAAGKGAKGDSPCSSEESKLFAQTLTSMPGVKPIEMIRVIRCFRKAVEQSKSGCEVGKKVSCPMQPLIGSSVEVKGWFAGSCENFLVQFPNSKTGEGFEKEYHQLFNLRWNPFALGVYKNGMRIRPEERENLEYLMAHLAKRPDLQRGIIRTVYLDDSAILQEHFDGADVEKWANSKASSKGVEVSNRQIMTESGSWLRIAKDLSHGLMNLHKMGIIHSDIKPGNSLVRNAHDPRKADAAYTDFGVSTVNPKCVDGKLVLVWGGTPEYVAPEHERVIPCDGPNDVKAIKAAQQRDVFAHAISLYELKYGKSPPWWERCPKDYIGYKDPCWQQEIEALQNELRSNAKGRKIDPVDLAIASGISFDPKQRPTSEQFVGLIDPYEISK